MPLGSIRPIWCHTCGEYVRPGSHGIHAMRYGRVALEASPEIAVGDARAVAVVVAATAGAGLFVVGVGILLSLLSR